MSMITEGKNVSIEYRVTLQDGTEVDSNLGEDALTYLHGSHEILPALQDALEGMKPGQNFSVTLSPQDAYGPIDDSSFEVVDFDLLPESLRYRGAEVIVEDDEDNLYKAKVFKITPSGAILDFNHPLAGHTLTFEVWVRQIQEIQRLN